MFGKMSKRRKNKKVREPTVEEQIRARVGDLLVTDNITPMLVYNLLLIGHRIYKQGIGIPTEHVWRSITGAFADNGRHYLTPGQIAALWDKEVLDDSDFDQLRT